MTKDHLPSSQIRKGRTSLLPAQRQQLIKEYLVKTGYVSISELGDRFSVSEMTIRRDLDELGRSGSIQRIYGGAVAQEPAFYEMSFTAKASGFEEQKRRIGKAASDLINPGQTIIIDSGTTTNEILKHTPDIPLTVITNAVNIAIACMNRSSTEVMIAGGMLRKGLNYTTGPQTSVFMRSIRADMLFLAVEGADIQAGLTVPDMLNADNKRTMFQCAKKTVVVTDHSKLGRVSSCSIIPLEDIHLLVTDKDADPELVEEFRQHVEVLLV